MVLTSSFRNMDVISCRFLKRNPSETVLLSIQKNEDNDDNHNGNTRPFAETVSAEIKPFESYHFHMDKNQTNSFPTLDQVRGKFILVSKDLGFGLDRTNWKTCNKWNIPDKEKVDIILKHIRESSCSKSSDDKFYLGYLSLQGTVLEHIWGRLVNIA